MLLILAAFAIYPLFVLVQMSMSDVGPTNIIGQWTGVGVANYGPILQGKELWLALGRTFLVAGVLLVVDLVGGFFVACALEGSGRLTSIVLGVMVFVWALPPVVSGSVWKFVLDDRGILNSVLGFFHVDPVPWLSSPSIALWTVSLVIAWASIPFATLIIRGALLALPPEVLEAASLDGAGYWRARFSIVLPAIRPTINILAVLVVINAFKSFDFFYVMTQGGPGTSTNTLPVLSYYTAFSNFDMSIGATYAVISMIVVIALSIPYVGSVRKEEAE